jgi:hypothetical protein
MIYRTVLKSKVQPLVQFRRCKAAFAESLASAERRSKVGQEIRVVRSIPGRFTVFIMCDESESGQLIHSGGYAEDAKCHDKVY